MKPVEDEIVGVSFSRVADEGMEDVWTRPPGVGLGC